MVDKKKIDSLKALAQMTDEERKELRRQLLIEEFNKVCFSYKELQQADLPPIEFLPTNTLIDKFVGGVEKGGITGLYGPTKSGKSFVALNIALNASKTSKVLFISCENSVLLDNERIKMMDDPKEQYNFTLFNTEVYVDKTYDEIFAIVKEVITDYDLVVIDGWNYILPCEEDGGSLFKSGGEFIRGLKTSISGSDTAVVLAWQLSRGCITQDIKNISSDDVAISIEIPRACVASYVIQRDKNGNSVIKHEYDRSRKDNLPKNLVLKEYQGKTKILYYNE